MSPSIQGSIMGFIVLPPLIYQLFKLRLIQHFSFCSIFADTNERKIQLLFANAAASRFTISVSSTLMSKAQLGLPRCF